MLIRFLLVDIMSHDFVPISISEEYTVIAIKQIDPIHCNVHALIPFNGNSGELNVEFDIFRVGKQSYLDNGIFTLLIDVANQHLLSALPLEYLNPYYSMQERSRILILCLEHVQPTPDQLTSGIWPVVADVKIELFRFPALAA